MQITGSKVTIGTNVEHTDKVESIHILSATQNNTQVNVQPQVQTVQASDDNSSVKQNVSSSAKGKLYFEGNKTDFARVINAGILKHCFRHKDGTIATQEEVFTAFSEAFNVDFTYYSRLLNHTRGLDESTNGKVFDSLKDLYIKYAAGEVGLQ